MKAISTSPEVGKDLRPGLYSVTKAPGLYLQVSEAKTKSWVFRYRLGPERRRMGLGSVEKVALADARKAATAAAAQRDKGIDPIDARQREKATLLSARAAARKRVRATTFRARAEAYIAIHSSAWKRREAATDWRNPFAKWIYPVIGDREITDIRLIDVVEALREAWIAVPETARRMRARMERVFDAAIAAGEYERANPAAQRLVETQLPKTKRVIEHFPAADLMDAPKLYRRIHDADGTAFRALEFMILTTARPSEARCAAWSEIDLDKKLWTIPAGRTKTAREHVVPLSEMVLAVLERQAKVRANDCVFPGQKPNAPLSYDGFAKSLIKIGITNATPHSFRSTFRDWAGDIGDVPRDLAETQLAHSLGNTEGAYRRLTAIEKRRVVLTNYAGWLNGEVESNVIKFKAG
jgi:integrase